MTEDDGLSTIPSLNDSGFWGLPGSQRVVDNTLPQSAKGYLAPGGCADPHAEASFDDFVDTFVNCPNLVVAYPDPDMPGVGGEFIKLIAKNADPLPRLDEVARQRLVPRADLLDEFTEAASHSKEWVGWLRFQWTSGIVDEYTSRVAKWKEALANAVTEIAPSFSQSPLAAELRNAPEIVQPDRRYQEEIRRLHIAGETYAIAYAFDWFARGHEYGHRSGRFPVLFHRLRDRAAAAETESVEVVKTPPDIKWHVILKECIRQGVLSADEGSVRLEDVLSALRGEVQVVLPGGYQEVLRDIRKHMGDPKSLTVLESTVIGILLGARLQKLILVRGSDGESTLREIFTAAFKANGLAIFQGAAMEVLKRYEQKSRERMQTPRRVIATIKRDGREGFFKRYVVHGLDTLQDQQPV